jgi:hypothetical protein
MKKIITTLVAALFTVGAWAQCQPIGWTLVNQKQLSVTERACTYEKSGYTVTIIVGGFCPFNPC